MLAESERQPPVALASPLPLALALALALASPYLPLALPVFATPIILGTPDRFHPETASMPFQESQSKISILLCLHSKPYGCLSNGQFEGRQRKMH